jgi:hypothetical protein
MRKLTNIHQFARLLQQKLTKLTSQSSALLEKLIVGSASQEIPLQNPTLGILVMEGGNVFGQQTGLSFTKAKV